MRRTISSSLTFLYKVIFPVLWIGGFAVATIAMFAGVLRVDPGKDFAGDPKWILLLAAVAGGVSIYWFCLRLKRVEIDSEALYISNFLGEISVPLRDVSEVRENRWVNIRPVTITFHHDTEFGRSIVFMPTMKLLLPFTSHPVVAELRSAVARAQGLPEGTGFS